MCNCGTEPCPLNQNCLASNLINKATVKTDNTTKIYIWSTSTIFKGRYRNHKASFNNKQKRYSKELPNYLCESEEKKEEQ